MAKLSVNVNKIATVRNSRGGRVPSVLEAVRVCVAAGSPGITVHPRADARHITAADVREIAAYLRGPDKARATDFGGPDKARATDLGGLDQARATERPAGVGRALSGPPPPVEFNIEGDPRPDLIELVHEVRPDQCTLVPVRPGEITSQAGWSAATPAAEMSRVVGGLRQAGIRVSLFVDPEEAPVRWAADIGADRVELYTEPYAREVERGADAGRRSFDAYARIATLAHTLGLGINAGHDLDLDNLVLFRGLPHLDEVSIGHALVSRALFVGLDRSVRDYLEVLAG